MISPDTTAYLATWANEISSRMNRVRNMIGSAHWPSDGAYKEHLLREILERHLPNYLKTHRGFIRDILDSNSCSPEVDILITDPTIHVPMFHEGHLQIVVPSCVLATAEIKSTYSSATLKAAVENVQRVRELTILDPHRGEVWSSILFAGADDRIPVHTLLNDIEGAIPSGCAINLLPQCVAVAGSGVAILQNTDSELNIRVFECEIAALPLALAYIFSHVQSRLRRDDRPGELEDLLRNIDYVGAKGQRILKVPRGAA